MKLIENKILEAIKKTISAKQCQLHEPIFEGKEKKYLLDCIKSTMVSSVGYYTKKSYIKKFENKIKKITSSKYVILTINGSAALHIAMVVAGVKKNQEILIPSFNYISSANAILYCNADPHFVDIEESTLGIDAKKLDLYLDKNSYRKKNFTYNKKTKKIIYAMVVLHTFGMPADIENLKKISKKYNIILIEDSAEALGSYYKKKHLGTFGLAGILSFNGNKIVTCGNGGAILTDSKSFYKKASHLVQLSKKKHDWKFDFDSLGYNYRLSNINAALGYAQIDRLIFFLKKKRRLFFRYKKNFDKIAEVDLFSEKKFSKSNFWLQAILLKKPNLQLRNKILNLTNKKNIGTRPVWELLHTIKYLKKFEKMNLKNSIKLSKRVINIPSSANI